MPRRSGRLLPIDRDTSWLAPLGFVRWRFSGSPGLSLLRKAITRRVLAYQRLFLHERSGSALPLSGALREARRGRFSIRDYLLRFRCAMEWKGNTDRWAFRAPLEIWAVLLFTAAMIPEVIWFSNNPMPFALAVSRLTSVTAVLGLCILGSVKPRVWHPVGFAVCACFFFAWNYEDTGTLNDMEAQVEKMVSGLPYGGRVVETINSWNDSRLWFINHMVDRVCIGKCFAYANYEPPAGQFRVRVKHGSPIVTDSVEDSVKMESGFYVVRQEDLPMNEIYQCDEKDLSKLCIRELSAGEENGRIGYRLPPL